MNKKNLFLSFFCLLAAMLLCVSCGDDDDDNNTSSSKYPISNIYGKWSIQEYATTENGTYIPWTYGGQLKTTTFTFSKDGTFTTTGEFSSKADGSADDSGTFTLDEKSKTITVTYTAGSYINFYILDYSVGSLWVKMVTSDASTPAMYLKCNKVI